MYYLCLGKVTIVKCFFILISHCNLPSKQHFISNTNIWVSSHILSLFNKMNTFYSHGTVIYLWIETMSIYFHFCSVIYLCVSWAPKGFLWLKKLSWSLSDFLIHAFSITNLCNSFSFFITFHMCFERCNVDNYTA